MKEDSLASVGANYSVLQNSLDEFSRLLGEISKCQANGVASEMTKFDFLFS